MARRNIDPRTNALVSGAGSGWRGRVRRPDGTHQIKLPTRMKLELARNYWDEMGRGNEKGMHGPMLERLTVALDIRPTIEGRLGRALAWPMR